jgi:hypothetical protein
MSDFVMLELLEELDYSYISPDSLEICLPSGHEFTLDHISSNSYSVLVRMQSKELKTWKRAAKTNNEEEGNYLQYQIHHGLIYFEDWNQNFQLCIPDSL